MLEAIAVFFFFFAPYFDLRFFILNGALITSVPILLVAVASGMRITWSLILYSISLVCVVFYAFLVGMFYSAELDLSILKIGLSIFYYIVFGFSFSWIFFRGCSRVEVGKRLEGFLVICAVVNSALVVVQTLFPEFRAGVEIILADAGNIDYSRSEELRYRGVASSGGASLSVFHGLALGLVISNFKSFDVLGYLKIFLLALSLVYIGRTGIFVAFVFVFLFALFSFKLIHLHRFAIAFFLIFGLLYLGGALFKESFYHGYVFGFLEVGLVDWFLSQGGSLIFSFYTLPETILKGLFGVGALSGAWVSALPSVDSGWMRMWTGFGVFFVLIYLVCLIFSINMSKFFGSYFWVVTILILILVDFKEMVALTGYTSRFIFFSLGVYIFLFSRSKRLPQY